MKENDEAILFHTRICAASGPNPTFDIGNINASRDSMFASSLVDA